MANNIGYIGALLHSSGCRMSRSLAATIELDDGGRVVETAADEGALSFAAKGSNERAAEAVQAGDQKAAGATSSGALWFWLLGGTFMFCSALICFFLARWFLRVKHRLREKQLDVQRAAMGSAYSGSTYSASLEGSTLNGSQVSQASFQSGRPVPMQIFSLTTYTHA